MTGPIFELGPLCPMRLPLLKSIPDVIYSLSSNSMDGTMGFVIHTYTIPHFGWTNAIVEVTNRCRTEDEQTVRIAFSERTNSSNCVLWTNPSVYAQKYSTYRANNVCKSSTNLNRCANETQRIPAYVDECQNISICWQTMSQFIVVWRPLVDFVYQVCWLIYMYIF